MTFWQQVFSPGGLAVAIVSVALGALLNRWLSRKDRERDEKRAVIRDVAEKYRDLCQRGVTSGVDGLLKSGVCRLRSHEEVEASISLIKNMGCSDPIASLRQKLEGKDALGFFCRMRDDNLKPFKIPDLEKAIAGAQMRREKPAN